MPELAFKMSLSSFKTQNKDEAIHKALPGSLGQNEPLHLPRVDGSLNSEF